MINSIRYVLEQHINNLYRIVSITRYDRICENRESKLGAIWNFLSPLLQIGTYWFVFGLGLRGGTPVNQIPFLHWMLAGLIPWFFLSACIKDTTSSILSKTSVLEKISFPTSILITTTVLNHFITHLIMLVVTCVLLFTQGFHISIVNLKLIYYVFCGIFFSISFGLVFSVLTMLFRDIKKLVTSCMRLLFYITPILWTTEKLPETIQWLMRLNPISYVVDGYRSSLFPQLPAPPMAVTIAFWVITIGLFVIGCNLIYKNRRKFIDLA